MAQRHGGRPKHIPQRTCVACRRVAGKRALIRLVRSESGVEVDPTGKRAGRGTYLHPNQQCWQIALRTGRIDQSLRIKLTADDRQKLTEFLQTLPPSEELAVDEAESEKNEDL